MELDVFNAQYKKLSTVEFTSYNGIVSMKIILMNYIHFFIPNKQWVNSFACLIFYFFQPALYPQLFREPHYFDCTRIWSNDKSQAQSKWHG